MKVEHVGRYDRRRKDGSPSGDREDALVVLWQKENDPSSSVNDGHGVLQHLLHASGYENPLDLFSSKFDGRVTQAEATAAATLIQWLGTNVGWCFLERCVKACGYKLVSLAPSGGRE